MGQGPSIDTTMKQIVWEDAITEATLSPHFSLRENDITGVLDHTFCVEHNAYGEIIQHELKPNGKSIPVTQDTKKEYVRLYVNWRFLRGIEAQFLALQKGFNEVIPQHLLKAFDEKELEVGSSNLNCLPRLLERPCLIRFFPGCAAHCVRPWQNRHQRLEVQHAP